MKDNIIKQAFEYIYEQEQIVMIELKKAMKNIVNIEARIDKLELRVKRGTDTIEPQDVVEFAQILSCLNRLAQYDSIVDICSRFINNHPNYPAPELRKQYNAIVIKLHTIGPKIDNISKQIYPN